MKAELVLVPGLMCDHAVWEPLLPWLEPMATCHVVDHGDADDLHDMARRLLARAPERFALAGHSMGGRVALEVMRRQPQRVTGLALLDTGYQSRPGGAAGDEERAKRQRLLDVAERDGVRAMATQWVQGMVHPERLGDAELIERIVVMFERHGADVFRRQVHALLHRPDAADVLARTQVPTLVLCGRDDGWAPVTQHQALLALLPAGRGSLQVIDRAGHMCTMERPQAVAQALQAWLQACAA